MSSLLPRKYNNPVVIGLGVALVVAVVIIVMTFGFTSRGGQATPRHEASPQHEDANTSSQVQSNETFIPTEKPTLVLFHANWCPHCKNILPTWESVKKTLEESGQFDVLDFEDSRDKDHIERASKLPGFRGYPDIRLYPQGYPMGEPIAYAGNRSEESIIKFAYTGGKQM